jgi:hypothetical protein
MGKGNERSGQSPVGTRALPRRFADFLGVGQSELQQSRLNGISGTKILKQVLSVVDILSRCVQGDGALAAQSHGHGQHQRQVFLAGGYVYG